MPSVIIDPPIAAGSVQFDILLDGVLVFLRIYYVERSSSWFGEIRNAADETVIRGAKRFAANYPFTFDGGVDGLPVGQLITVTGTSPPEPIRLRDLSNVAFIYYASPDDNTLPQAAPFVTGVTP